MQVFWSNSASLNSTDWTRNSSKGVYVIWRGIFVWTIVYVGRGDIGDRLYFHQTNLIIQKHRNFGLYARWAAVYAEVAQKGAESYLQRVLNLIYRGC